MQEHEKADIRTLTAQDRIEFERAYYALQEQLGQTDASPAQQTRMRLARWIFRTGLETNRADFDLLDCLCRDHEAGERESS